MSPTPLTRRPLDLVLVAFFALNFFFITYMIDIEQIVIPDPSRFSYPFWPPRFAVDAIHWWSSVHDPLVWARPPWYRATIWVDALLFGPFYLAAMVALVREKAWIRTPALVWAGMMIAIVFTICFEEIAGPHATPHPVTVLGANAPWLALPLVVIWRFRAERPFGR
ncbi:MAG TPA: emopamil-binding family protein [Candidatus Sulfotelmatobacter sp.]|nr:emopamil-binding family protein [Candidatus Sulfotelmatobacter sp.]